MTAVSTNAPSAGHPAHRSPAARSQRARTRGRPEPRRHQPEAPAFKHKHPGEEIIYVLKGSLEYQIEGQAPPPVSVPVGFTTFPGEIWASPRSWVEAVYPGLAYFNEVDKGGHFAAWEEPELFSDEVRAAFRSLR